MYEADRAGPDADHSRQMRKRVSRRDGSNPLQLYSDSGQGKGKAKGKDDGVSDVVDNPRV